MGYKSFLRSVNASANRAAKESQRRQRQQARATERINKKAAALGEKKGALMIALELEYAAGKISQEQFNELKKRESDIGLELIVFGKAAGVALGKRYICGKIDKAEFEQIQKEILPAGYFTERENIMSGFAGYHDKIAEFKKQCAPPRAGICQKCGVEKRFFRRIRSYEGLLLCARCQKELERLRRYPGFMGEYLMTPPRIIEDGGTKIRAVVKPEYL